MIMFPGLPDTLPKEAFQRLARRLPPKQAEAHLEFCTVCEILEALKQTGYPRPRGLSEYIEIGLTVPITHRAIYWREMRHDLLEHLEFWQRAQNWPLIKLLDKLIRAPASTELKTGLPRVDCLLITNRVKIH